MEIYPYTIVLFSLYLGFTTFFGVREGIRVSKERVANRLPKRQGDKFASLALSNQKLMLIVIFVVWYSDKPNWVNFGYNGDHSSILIWFLLGSIAYFALTGAYTLILHLQGVLDQQLAESYLVHRSIIPRSTGNRGRLLAVLLINPFTEELLYRGFLVYYLGNLLDSVWLFSILGVAVCLLVHFYQGARMLHFHAMFCVASILILFSPAGIVGCFGFHLAGDLFPFAMVRRAQKAWKAQQR